MSLNLRLHLNYALTVLTNKVSVVIIVANQRVDGHIKALAAISPTYQVGASSAVMDITIEAPSNSHILQITS